MKKPLFKTLVLALVMALAFSMMAGCGGDGNTEGEGNQSDEVKDFLKGDADREQRERKEKKIVKENEKIIEEGIESMQVNGGRSDAAMEADYEYEQFPAPEMEETEEESFGFENFTAEALLHLAEISPEEYESLKKEYEQRTGLSADEYLKKAGDKERQEKNMVSDRKLLLSFAPDSSRKGKEFLIFWT